MVKRTPAIMVENDEDEQELECNCWDDEEVCRNRLLGVVVEKRPPGLRRKIAVPHNVFGDCCLRNFDSDLPQLSVNARNAPARVGQADFTNEIPNFRTDGPGGADSCTSNRVENLSDARR